MLNGQKEIDDFDSSGKAAPSTMKLGVPKESVAGECRVSIVPDVARQLISRGFRVLVETEAGEAAGFHDYSYRDAGAEMVSRADALTADVVAKVRKPSMAEVRAMRDGALYVGLTETCEDDGTLAAMNAKDVRILSLEGIPRISRAQPMDALSSQANIMGYRAVVEAAARFGRFVPMMMTAAGSAKPARVVVLGAGVAGLQAIATARRMGADVYGYDIRPETQEQIESLGAKAIELDVGESGSGLGGYAKELSEEAKGRQQAMLADELAKAHIIITTALIPCRPAPVLVVEDVVRRMREGSVIVDLAAASGGNCPLTEADQVVVKHGVTLVGYTNYPSMVPADASSFYARNISSLLGIAVENTETGLKVADLEADEITQHALVRFGG